MPEKLVPTSKKRNSLKQKHHTTETSASVRFALSDESGSNITFSFQKCSDLDSTMDCNTILVVLRSADVQEDNLIKCLSQLSENISVLDRENEDLVGAVLKLQWADKSDKLSSVYVELILHLVTSHTFYLRRVLKMILDIFLIGGEDEIKPTLFSLSQKKQFANSHKLLQEIFRLVPMSPTLLVPMLSKGFPFLKKDAVVQVSYTYNLLEIIKYLPHMRRDLLELLIKKFLKIDVHCAKCDIEDAEANIEESVFPMEEDDVSSDVAMKHPLANVLDLLMLLIFDYIDSICKVEGSTEIDWEATKKMYKDFLAIFDSVILPTFASSHVQFLLFYICSFRQPLCEGYLDYLWKKVQNPNVSPILRQTAACYIGSFISRAKYVSINMAKDCLLLMTKWIHRYIDNQDGSSHTFVDVVHHGTFYAVCQTVFYIFAFRHKELVEARKGLNFLKNLNFDRIVTCRLNPLKVCLPTVVKNFANIARNYQIAYCYTIIERNNRMLLPTVQENSVQGVVPSMESFFPFDPYLLKRSKTKIENVFRVYEKQDEEMLVDKEEDDDFLPEHAGSEQLINVQDFLSYSTSPGFKQTTSPKFR